MTVNERLLYLTILLVEVGMFYFKTLEFSILCKCI